MKWDEIGIIMELIITLCSDWDDWNDWNDWNKFEESPTATTSDSGALGCLLCEYNQRLYIIAGSVVTQGITVTNRLQI